MKKNFNPKAPLIAAFLFFLLINTSYYWEGKLGLYAFPAFAILAIAYISLSILLFQQVYAYTKEKFANKSRLIVAVVLFTVLAVTFLKPLGIINYDKFQGEDLLIAEREGAANCMTTLQLKEDFTFKEKSVCFGITETTGKFHLQHDTIYFDDVHLDRHEKKYYQFAVIKPSKFNKDGNHIDLTRYESIADTTGYDLWITKNELTKMKLHDYSQR